MKKYSSLIMVALFVLSLSAYAQPQKMKFRKFQEEEMCMPHKRGMQHLPDLTDAQKEQIEKLRTDHLKTILPLRNKLGELRAELRTLSTADKANMNDINKKIDQIGNVRTQLMKEQAAQRQQIRSLLTDEQRVKFDSHAGRGPMGRGGMQKYRPWQDD